MDMQLAAEVTAFSGKRWIASGALGDVARAAKAHLDRGDSAGLLVFDDTTGEVVEVDFRGTLADVAARTGAGTEAPSPAAAGNATSLEPEPAQRGRGRPRLGVIAREVTLLPRHWDWLGSQPGGASVVLRKLVETAKRANEGRDALRRSQEAVYRFALAMAGNEPGFEEAVRALYAADEAGFASLVTRWPPDIARHVGRLAQGCFGSAA
ncbi:MAG: DUF2239 family protein [Pseudomonadota bacterium]